MDVQPAALRKGGRRLLSVIAAVSAMVVAGAVAHSYSEQRAMSDVRQDASHKLDLFAAAAQGVVRQLEHAPATIQLNPEVLALLRAPHHPYRIQRVNSYLLHLNGHLGSLAVYILNERGIVLASSDAGSGASSLIGSDLSFRPYFLDALSGRVGRHFAIGIQGSEPGYFVSHPIHDGAQVVGVAAIKISLAPIAETWQMLGAPALVADSNRVAILASEPSWHYTALMPLTDEQRVDIQLSRLYGTEPLGPFPIALPQSILDESAGRESVIDMPRPGMPPSHRSRKVIATARPIDGMDWRVVLFTDLSDVRSQALTHGLLAALTAGLLCLLLVLMQQRRRIVQQKLEAKRLLERSNAELERQVVRRTSALSDTNARLRQEIQDRKAAEASLRTKQDELVHAAKMAALGQLATGITHELSQPLGGIRTLAGNAVEFLRRGEEQTAVQNLEIVARLVDQMGRIIEPLKGFARKSAPKAQVVDIAQVVRNALFLYDPRIRKTGVQVHDTCAAPSMQAWCDANRLEQVLINLVGNALDAMSGQADAKLALSAGRDGNAPDGEPLTGWIWLKVEDTGAGFDEEQRQRLFEPFFTTKAAGSGLGLGLAISRDIVREFGGDIHAYHRPGGGASFLVRMPPVPVEHTP